jgi:hypothetical protein
MPSLESSPMMRGEPHVGLALDISRIRFRTTFETRGRPGFPERAQLGPIVSEPFALPGDHFPRLYEDEGSSPAGPGSGKQRPEDAVSCSKSGPPSSSLEDGELVPKGKDLELQRSSRTEGGGNTGHDGNENRLHRETVTPYRLPRSTRSDWPRERTPIASRFRGDRVFGTDRVRGVRAELTAATDRSAGRPPPPATLPRGRFGRRGSATERERGTVASPGEHGQPAMDRRTPVG